MYESTNVSLWTYNIGATLSFTSRNGIISSPSYPENYPDNTDCIYHISQSTDTLILLNFINIDIENDTSCKFDYLEIRDGPSEASTIIETLCGREADFLIQSSQNNVWMK